MPIYMYYCIISFTLAFTVVFAWHLQLSPRAVLYYEPP